MIKRRKSKECVRPVSYTHLHGGSQPAGSDAAGHFKGKFSVGGGISHIHPQNVVEPLHDALAAPYVTGSAQADPNGVLSPALCRDCLLYTSTGAIQFYTMEPAEMEKKVADEGLEVYLPELNTKPHVFYKNMYRFLKAFVSGELLKGGECAEGVSVTLKGAGVDEQQYTDCFGEFKFDALEPGDYTLYADGREIKKVRVKESVNVGEIVLD